MSEMFAQVILPLPVHDTYTYKIPPEWVGRIRPGQRVVVQFGSKKLYTALVCSLAGEAAQNLEIKEILELLDEKPLVLPHNFELWQWMAAYYCCALGDVYKAALPPGLKMESKSNLVIAGDFNNLQLPESEQVMVNLIKNRITTVDGIQNKLGKSFSYAALKSLLEKNMVKVEEKMGEKYRPKTDTFVRLNPGINTKDLLRQAIDSLIRAKRQQELLMHFCAEAGVFQSDQKSLSRKDLLKGNHFNNSILNALVEKGILEVYQKEISRIEAPRAKQYDINFLNSYQQNAMDEIKACFKKKQVALIHGITASGKTEIYIHLINETIKSGLQALYLLPEIALTTQITDRLRNVFGSKVGIYHSRLNSHERVEIWNKVLQFQDNPAEGCQVILGARSALFMPFSRLGLIIVDEEHENTFKQFDPAPRYHARDMAVVMGKLSGCDVLLGSATPSFESYHNALIGKYGLVKLEKRFSDSLLPRIIVADLKKQHKKDIQPVLTRGLYNLVEEALQKKEQVVFFQNRRGYSPYIQCGSCGMVPKCIHCDVTLTYHKYNNRLNCHYCGYSTSLPGDCPGCGSAEIKPVDFGTEKVEEELKSLFPEAKIERMDLDTTRSKHSFERIILNMETGKTDILIGTQMVTKGLDFNNVSVVGILNADNLINFPDFRAHERAYQLISQVSGRAGRRKDQGKVVVQTSQPGHPLIELISRQDYTGAFSAQMQERKLFNYPPFSRLIKVVVKHKKADMVNIAADRLAGLLRKNKNMMILGPEFPFISRIQLWYNKEIWVKLSRTEIQWEVKQFVLECIEKVRKEKSGCLIYMDVDPY